MADWHRRHSRDYDLLLLPIGTLVVLLVLVLIGSPGAV